MGAGWLAAALTLAPAPVEPVRPGTITVELVAGAANPDEDQLFVEAVASALANAQFVPLATSGKGRYIARVTITRTPRGLASSDPRTPRTAGGLGNWGATVAVTLPSNKSRLRSLIVTRLEVQIVRRDGHAGEWSGQALTVQAQGSRDDAPPVLATKLANAAIRHFPEQSSQPASVP